MTLAEFIDSLPVAIETKHSEAVNVVALGISCVDALEAAAPDTPVPQYAIAREQLQIAGGASAQSQGAVGRALVGRALHISCIACVAAQALTDQQVADLLEPIWA